MTVSPPSQPFGPRWFWFACGFESCLAVLGWGIMRLAGTSPSSLFQLQWQGGVIGLLATVPLLLAFALLLRYPPPFYRRIMGFLDGMGRTIFQGWAIWQLAAVSALAGLGEEILFRAALQGMLSRWLGWPGGLLVGSLLFGLAHCVTASYAVLAALLGAFLGWLWLATGDLAAPIVTHAAYDFLVLLILRRRWQGQDAAAHS